MNHPRVETRQQWLVKIGDKYLHMVCSGLTTDNKRWALRVTREQWAKVKARFPGARRWPIVHINNQTDGVASI